MARSIPFFLPTSQAVATRFIAEKVAPDSPLERAALFAACFITERRVSTPEIGRILAAAQDLFAKDAALSLPHLLGLHARIASAGIESLAARMEEQGIFFLPEGLVPKLGVAAEAPYTDDLQILWRDPPRDCEITFYQEDDGEGAESDEGLMESAPCPPQRMTLRGSRDQAVVANVIAAGPGELVEVDGYAGTGKTHLVLALSETLGPAITCVAPRKAQLHGVEQRDRGGMKTTTLVALANELAAHCGRMKGIWVPRFSRPTHTLASQARFAEITPLGNRTPAQVMAVLYKGLSSWCYSDDLGLHAKHFKRVLPNNEDPWPFVALGLQLWKVIFQRPAVRESIFPVTLLYLGKWLALNLDEIPARHGLLLVDEAHDLPPAWRYLFSRYAGGCVLMGDPYQKLQGRSWTIPGAMKRTMSHSFRTGLQGGAVVEGALSLAPKQLVPVPFVADRGHVTTLRHDDSPTRLQMSGLRVYGSEWALLEDALHIKESGGTFQFPPATVRELKSVVRSAVSLCVGGGTFYQMKVTGCTTKHELLGLLERERRLRILDLLERGYGGLDHAWQDLVDHAGQGGATITLSLIDHAKNLEESVVMLNGCCFTREGLWREYSPVHAAYLGMTRARDELWIPGEALGRLSDISQEQSRKSVSRRVAWL